MTIEQLKEISASVRAEKELEHIQQEEERLLRDKKRAEDQANAIIKTIPEQLVKAAQNGDLVCTIEGLSWSEVNGLGRTRPPQYLMVHNLVWDYCQAQGWKPVIEWFWALGSRSGSGSTRVIGIPLS